MGIWQTYQRQQLVNALQLMKAPNEPTILGRLNNNQMPGPVPRELTAPIQRRTSSGPDVAPTLEDRRAGVLSKPGDAVDDALRIHSMELERAKAWEESWVDFDRKMVKSYIQHGI